MEAALRAASLQQQSTSAASRRATEQLQEAQGTIASLRSQVETLQAEARARESAAVEASASLASTAAQLQEARDQATASEAAARAQAATVSRRDCASCSTPCVPLLLCTFMECESFTVCVCWHLCRSRSYAPRLKWRRTRLHEGAPRWRASLLL